MKASILLILGMTFGIFMAATAQDRHINFEQNRSWEEVVRKAKKANKLIFVDCYTSWCGPCKLLARDVFTDNEVADFFNMNFVNAKYDMEKDADGVALKKQFGVTVFPTLLFVDAHSGEVVHRMAGAGTPAWLIAGATSALEPNNNLRTMMKRYAAGERTAELIRNYVSALYTAYQRDEAARVACEYLDPLPVDSLYVAANWQMIDRYVSDPLSPLLKRVMAQREKLYPMLGHDEVDRKLEKSILDAVIALAKWQPEKQKPFDERRHGELLRYLQQIDFYAAPAGLAWLYTASYIRRGDFRGMLDKMKEILSYNLFRRGAEITYFQHNLRKLVQSDDKELLLEGTNWIDEWCVASVNWLNKANFMRTKAILQQKAGDTDGAENSRKEAEKYLQEFRKRK